MSELVLRSSRPTPLRNLLSPVALVADLVRYGDLLKQFARREVEARHKGTLLGAAWTVFNPLIQLLIYTFIFGVVFAMKWGRLEGAGASDDAPNPGEFALTFFAAYVAFTVFQECATKAPGLIADRPNLVRKVVFPLEVLPVSVLLAQLFYAAIGVSLLLIATFITTGRISPTVWLFPVVCIPLSMFALAAAWLLSALGVYIRDLKQVVPVLTQMLFFATPIFYPIKNVPEQYRPVMEANPFTSLVEMTRQTLLWGEAPNWRTWGMLTLGGAVAMQLAYAWFMRARRGFADVV
jgi:lipopolysaccharide transport system permease protein